MDDDNIIRLAEHQDRGELPPTAEEALALAFAARHEAPAPRCQVGALAKLRRLRWQLDDTLHAFDLPAIFAARRHSNATSRQARSPAQRPSPPLSGSQSPIAG